MDNQSNFLESIASKCKTQFGDNCNQLTVIFPNKRAGIYFADYLARQYDRPIWSPSIYSFEEYIENETTRSLADELQLIFLLYNTYKEIVKQPETFDAFYSWGEMILNDFNDIDNYLIEDQHIFRVIKSQKELDESFGHMSEEEQKVIHSFWKGFLPDPNKKQREFISAWSILAELYGRFNQQLQENDLTYKGRMLRDYAEAVIEKREDSYFWFVGFNALTKAEEKIIKTYLSHGNADIFWDLDEYYFQDPMQESGQFFREYARDTLFKTSIERDIKKVISTRGAKIEVLSVSFAMAQIKSAAQKIESIIQSSTEQSKLLVILTDESYLPGLLSTLSPHIEYSNVTMGWSVSQSEFYLLLLKLIAVHSKAKDNTSKPFHHQDISSILEYHDLLGIAPASVTAFKKDTIERNLIFHEPEDLIKCFPSMGGLLTPPKNASTLIEVLTAFISAIPLEGQSDMERSTVVLIHVTLKRLQRAIFTHEINLEIQSFYKLFQKLGTSIKIPLSGDPTQGIQIMGILETRNLSFENVIIVGMNEGAWPKDSSNTSFIPYNIRRAFDLPSIKHQDATQSYLFYRLLHSTKNLWLSYNNISEFNHNGDLSRYIKQLQYESKLNIQVSNLVSPITAEKEQIIIVKKGEDVQGKLDLFLVKNDGTCKRMSPSALNTYIDCKLKFYFQQIAHIREPDDLTEDMDPSLFGNLLHRTMEHLYEGHLQWSEEDFTDIEGQIEKAINQSFADQKLTPEAQKSGTGRQIIAYEVIKQFSERIVAFDINNTPFEILGLETDMEVDMEIELASGLVKVGLRGIIDRTDRYKETVRILDYKSGRDKRSFNEMSDLIDGNSIKRNKAVFQLFYYCMLYKENNQGVNTSIQPGMFNSKDLFEKNFDAKISHTPSRSKVINYADYEEEFKETLHLLLSEIFNPEIPFSQTQDTSKCQYCPYQNICMRA